ncbi:hypothetical protein [Streptomyces sp. HUAS TT20]|uniref:hypothetical protein n=1 Tax=Streptomyces sp. HUAS TT20 TaxID=3447509 RepID=UPI0021D81325|nr:hypothetical protein [Streptomyces sp. HUAS 15-9]UXY29491.1 hypothetical protein N8I87_24990 [Streptomyces sp. HUAS 15-9]
MGERRSGGGLSGRRRVHPDGADPRGTFEPENLEVLLGAALRAGAVDPEAEQRAAAAFRAARDAGAHRAGTRRRDDWQPRERGRARRSVRTTVTMALASLTLGGVAVAAIGTVTSSHGGNDDGHHPAPATGTTDGPAVRPSRTSLAPSGPATHGRPDTANDTLAHCRAYEQAKDRGKALGSTAWQRLAQAAGGEQNVAAYCARQLAQTESDKAKQSGNTGKGDKSDESGSTVKGSPNPNSTKKK